MSAVQAIDNFKPLFLTMITYRNIIFVVVFYFRTTLSRDVYPELPSNNLNFCSENGFYVNGTVTSLDECFTIEAINNCASHSLQDSPFCETNDCNIHLNAFIASDENGDFARFEMNITVVEKLEDKLFFMYEDIAEPQYVKCFNVLQNKREYPRCSKTSWNYDCSVKDHGSKLMQPGSFTALTFLVNGRKIQYKFRNLISEDLKNDVIFFYVHTVKDESVIVTFQLMTGIEKYQLKLQPHDKQMQLPVNVTINLLDNSTYLSRYANMVTVKIPPNVLKIGSYNLSLECYDIKSCNSSKTFPLIINSRYYTAEIIITVTLVVLLILSTFLATVILYLRRESRNPVPEHVTMLLICDAATVLHTDYVKATQAFLREQHGIQVLLDLTDLPSTEHQDAVRWYKTVWPSVDYFAIVAPPRSQPYQQRGDPIQNTFPLALRMLELDNTKNSTETIFQLSRRYFVFRLPDSDPDFVPRLPKFTTCFLIPTQLNILRQHFLLDHRNNCCLSLASCFVFKKLLQAAAPTTEQQFFRILCEIQSRRQVPYDVTINPPDNVTNTAQIEEENGLLTEELDVIYGDITSVKKLPSVINHTDAEDITSI